MNKQVKGLIKQAQALLSNPIEAKSEDLKEVLSQINATLDEEEKTPWWVIVLKVIAYALGLILAGYGTTAAAMTLNAML